MTDIHPAAKYGARVAVKLDNLYRRWSSLTNAAAYRDYQNEEANGRADRAWFVYQDALDEAKENSRCSLCSGTGEYRDEVLGGI